MKNMFLTALVCLSSMTYGKTLKQCFLNEKTKGLPSKICIEKYETIGNNLHIIGTEDEMYFESLSLYSVSKIDGSEYLNVKATILKTDPQTMGCVENSYYEIIFNFKKNSLKGWTLSEEVVGNYFYTSDDCHSDYQVSTLNYTLDD